MNEPTFGAPKKEGDKPVKTLSEISKMNGEKFLRKTGNELEPRLNAIVAELNEIIQKKMGIDAQLEASDVLNTYRKYKNEKGTQENDAHLLETLLILMSPEDGDKMRETLDTCLRYEDAVGKFESK